MIDDLQAFRAVAELQSFSKAARQLRISSSVVTRRIARLEQHLQIKLLQRSTRQVSLTELGADYLLQITDILQQLELSYTQLKQRQQQITGTLRVGVPYSIMQSWIIPKLAAWHHDFPELQIDFIQGNHLTNMIADKFDVVIYCGNLPDASYYHRHLANWHKHTCASPSFLKTYGIPKTPQALAQYACLDHANNYHQGWGYQIKGQYYEQVIKAVLRSDSSTSLCDLAVQGLGITYLPDFTIHDAVKAGTLVPILKEFQLASLGIYAVYPSRSFLPKKTQLFLDFMQFCFSELK